VEIFDSTPSFSGGMYAADCCTSSLKKTDSFKEATFSFDSVNKGNVVVGEILVRVWNKY
jgi:hypothetical protein